MVRIAGWLWRHRSLTCLGLLLTLIGLLNLLAYNHAWAMTHFRAAGTRTGKPETLSAADKLGVLLTGITLPKPVNRHTPADVQLDFEVRHIAGAAGTLEAWYVPRSQPRAVIVMFHGYAACKDSLLDQARVCHELGCAVLLVDQRGSGGSAGNVTTIGVHEADDVARAYAHVRKLLPETPIVLYGMSMGAASVLRACAIHGLQPAGLILESCFERLTATVAARFRAMGLPGSPGAELLVFWGGVQHGFDGFRHNPVDYAPQVACPVLLLHGGVDPRVSEAEARSLHAAFVGPKQIELFEQAGHEPLLDADSARWRQAVSKFFASVGSAN